VKLNLNTLAPILAITFLVLAGSAWKYGNQFKSDAVVSSQAEAKARMDTEVAEIALSSLGQMKRARSRITPAEKSMALANGVGTVMGIATVNGVKIEAITSQTKQQMAKGVKIDSLFTPVPLAGGKLHKAEILIKGSYRDLAGFNGFFDALGRAGLSTQKLSVKKSSFEATVRIFGE
jgi:hypothetical protein